MRLRDLQLRSTSINNSPLYQAQPPSFIAERSGWRHLALSSTIPVSCVAASRPALLRGMLLVALRRYAVHGSVDPRADPASNHAHILGLHSSRTSLSLLLPCHLGFHLASARRLIPCTLEGESLALCFILTSMVWGSSKTTFFGPES